MWYWLLVILLYPVGVLPRRALQILSGGLAFVMYHIARYRRTVVMRNLQQCFPQKSDAERRNVARGVYRNLCDLMLNMLRIRFASAKRVLSTVKYINPDIYERYADRNMILFAAHYSCWEYISTAQLQTPKHKAVAAYQPTRGAMERLITEQRKRFGAELVPLSKVFRKLLEYNNLGEKTYTLMVTDQSPAAGSCDFRLTFLGQEGTPAFITSERIAKKTNSVVFYLRTRELRRFSYSYEIVVLSENAAAEKEGEVMRRFFAELEKDVVHSPQLWMWTHRRWKNQKQL